MFDLPAKEQEILDFWKKNKIFEKSLEKKSPEGDFVFYEGPPTANGKPGIHHVIARAFKDLIPRYKTMRGFYVERKAGWDTHGLPVELEVEKQLKLANKKEIEDYGIEKFNQKCKESVWKYKEDWEKMTERIGFWIDMKNPYITYENNYIESLWWIIKEVFERGFLYQGHKVVPQCPSCGTTLSSHEVAQGYKNVEEESITVKFRIIASSRDKNASLRNIKDNVFILAWTTTPWTLPGNVALAVGEKIDYVIYRVSDHSFIEDGVYINSKADLESAQTEIEKEKNQNSNFKLEVLKEVKGKDLIGLEYEPLFDLGNKNDVLNLKEGKKQATATVILKDGKVLLGLREYSKTHNIEKDFWVGPGGKSEKDEILGETLRRELKEECGVIDYKIKKYLGSNPSYVDNNTMMYWFLIEVEDLNQIKNGEPDKFKEWKWFDINEVPDNIPHKNDIEYYKQALVWDKAYKVYPADFVSIEEGTGVVHTAVMYGQDDYELGEKVGLPKVHSVNLDGTFNELVPQWRGKFVKDVEKDITKDLEKRNLLFNKKMHAHDYPFCWRCDSPLIYYAKDSWFFKMSALREQLIKNNETINWVPEHIKEGRFGEWLREVKDWAISRERYWGTPIPVWVCEKCDEKKVVGSFEELEKLSGKKVEDPHRPFIDEITFSCHSGLDPESQKILNQVQDDKGGVQINNKTKCNGTMRRVPEVMDCWFDSGAMPFAQLHYPFENKKEIDKSEKYPAEFICEAIDQTRGWFYTLLAVATLLGKKAPYQNVICLGHILDKNGQKMSKHVGNVVDPNEMVNKYGADAVRWYFYTVNQPGEPKRFDEQVLKESSRMFITLMNVLSFYLMYVNQISDTGHLTLDTKPENVLDKWVAAKLNLLIKEVGDGLEKYDIFGSARKIEEFINELSTWYVRRSRERFKGEDEKDKNQAIFTLGKVLFELSKLLAPFVPFTAEHLYQELGKKCGCLKESVHLEDWPACQRLKPQAMAGRPEYNKKLIDQKVLDYMAITRQVVELGLAKRAEVGIKVRQPLLKLKVKSEKLKIEEEYINLIKDELNVREVVQEKGEGELSVELDTEISDELKEEGILRELTRTINGLRKDAGLTIDNFINLEYNTSNEQISCVFEKYQDELKKSVLAQTISKTKEGLEKVKINEAEVGLKITKV